MEKLLADLGELLLKAVPTFLLVVLLHFYLKKVYFGPMSRTLKQRYDATEGARKLAEESFARASQKAAEYDAALREARSEIYREQERFRHDLRQQQAEASAAARASAAASVEDGKRQIAAELEAARESLRAENEPLSNRIVDTILRRRPA